MVILLLGLAIRFYDLTDAPLDFHPTRQLYSALKARGMFYENLETVPEWQRDFAVHQWKLQGYVITGFKTHIIKGKINPIHAKCIFFF